MNRLTLLSDIARRGADRFADRVALEGLSPKSAVTYGQLWRRVAAGAGTLRRLGLARGERVLLVAAGSPDWAAAFFSIVQADLGAVLVPPTVAPDLVRAVAFHTAARACVVDVDGLPWAALLGHIPVVTTRDLVAGEIERIAKSSAQPGDVAVLAFTSGSTARPRAVALTHDNLLASLRALPAVRQAAGDEAFLSILPPAHLYELVAGLLAPLAIGARVVYPGAPLPNRLVDALRGRRITHALAVPGLVDALCREVVDQLAEASIVSPECRQAAAVDIAAKLRRDTEATDRIRSAVRARIGHSFRTLVVGGAALAPGWPEALTLLGVEVEVGYGLTEASPLVSVGRWSDCPRGSVGRALPGVEVRIDETGEVLVRGPNVMRGYFGDPAGSASALQDGWLHTGDLGRLDERGFLYLTGRIKESIVLASGETLQPEEIEPYYASRLFAEHCVVPAPGADGNDVPALVAVPARPRAPDEELERAFFQLRAAAPARCHVATMVLRPDPLPRTMLGKLRRRAIGEMLATVRSAELQFREMNESAEVGRD